MHETISVFFLTQFPFPLYLIPAHHHRTTNIRLFRIYVCAHSCQLPPYNFHNFWALWRVSISWKISSIGKFHSQLLHGSPFYGFLVRKVFFVCSVRVPKTPFGTQSVKFQLCLLQRCINIKKYGCHTGDDDDIRDCFITRHRVDKFFSF